MADWGVASGGFYRHTVPPRWLNGWVLHADRLRPRIHFGDLHLPSCPPAPQSDTLTGRAVTPVDFVELRALEIERNESHADALRAVDSSPVRRLWPFRWPTIDPPEVIEPIPIPATPEKGAYIDVLV